MFLILYLGWELFNILQQLMSSGGWSYTVPAAADTLAHYTAEANGHNVNCPYYTNFRFVDSDGARHGLGLYVLPGSAPCTNYSHLSGGDITYQASLSLSAACPVLFWS